MTRLLPSLAVASVRTPSSLAIASARIPSPPAITSAQIPATSTITTKSPARLTAALPHDARFRLEPVSWESQLREGAAVGASIRRQQSAAHLGSLFLPGLARRFCHLSHLGSPGDRCLLCSPRFSPLRHRGCRGAMGKRSLRGGSVTGTLIRDPFPLCSLFILG